MILLKMCKIMEILVLLALILATSAAPNIQPLQKTEEARVATNSEYRLASTVQPVSYDINLVIPQQALAEGNNTSYSGSVNINTTVTQAANTILIHSLVYIENISVEMDFGTATVPNITNVTVSWSGNNETEITTIVLPNNLTVGTVCLLHIDFIGSLDAVNMEGFYRSEYETNGTKEFLATTQFQPTHARMAFPCFDEPQYKAVFTLTLTYPSGYVARANTPEISSTIEPPGTSGTITTSFQQTPRMSTYLLAFTISKFDCTANSSIASGTTVGVCSRADFADDRNFSAEYGKTILNAMNQWTTLDYNTSGINKLDQFAIPDFSAGAMENWGLVTYREFLLLYNGLDTSNDFKQQILTVIAHEIAHMWFGNLVTTEWWDTLFLNEGFATYFSYFILNEIPELANYEMNKQFVIDAQQLALSQDATLSSPTLSAEAWTPTQIWNKFNVLTYYKGASIFRMIENLMGTTNFKEGLIEFLTSNQYGAVTPAVLWDTLSRYANVSLLPPNISLATVASTWTDQPGFPVVNATLIDGAVILTQERFLNTLNSDNASYQWYIPITFRLIDSDTTSTTWLLANNETVINMESNNTIILNYNAEGFYRVYYDAALREKIVSTLLSNHTLISDITRAQIIDDALTFAQANILNHSESFKFLNYLTNETSYYPWYSAIKGLNYIFLRLDRESAMTQRVNDLLLSLMQNVYPNISGTNWENQMESLRTTLLWSTACQAGHTSCIEEARSLFDAFRENNTGINSNIRTTVYCTALRYSNDSERDFNFLLNRLLTVDQPHETLYLLQSLGCATNRNLLLKYLEESIRSNSSIRLQDITTVWSSVYTSSSQGADVAFDYFIENYPAIISHYRDGRMLLPAIVSRFTQYNQIIKLLNFISQLPENDTLRLIAEASSILAVQNLGHQEIISRDLENHFNSENETPVDPSITTTTSSAAIYGLSFVALLFSLIVIYYP